MKIRTPATIASKLALIVVALMMVLVLSPAQSAPSKPNYSTPTQVQPWIIGCDGFGIEWNASPYADFYVMRYSRYSDYRNSSYVRLTTPNVTEANVDHLPPSTRFYAKVGVANIEGQRLSSYSRTVSLKTSPPCGSDNDD